MKTRSAAASAAALTVATLTSLAQSYNVRDPGAVAGQNQSTGFGLNALGQAAGDSIDIHSPWLFPAGTQATGMNDSGVAMGRGWLTTSSSNSNRLRSYYPNNQ